MKFHNLLVIALVIIRRTHKAHRTDKGAENPTGPKLPDFTLCRYMYVYNPNKALLRGLHILLLFLVF